jgi:prepilin-type N-terminal cleavage/methylation domain-containing protein
MVMSGWLAERTNRAAASVRKGRMDGAGSFQWSATAAEVSLAVKICEAQVLLSVICQPQTEVTTAQMDYDSAVASYNTSYEDCCRTGLSGQHERHVVRSRVPSGAERRSGVSIVELLIVIAILGILAALILPAVQVSREAARRVQCSSNLRQIALAVQEYTETHSAFPGDGGGPARQSFHVRLLPFTEQESLYAQIDFDIPIEMQGSIASSRPAYLSCPSDPTSSSNRAFNSYSGNAGWPTLSTPSPDLVPGSETRATGVISSVLPIELPGWQRLAGRHDQCNLKSHRQLHLFHTIGTKVAQVHP